MECKFCKEQLFEVDHLPTEECPTYTFACGTTLHNGNWDQSLRCESDVKEIEDVD